MLLRKQIRKTRISGILLREILYLNKNKNKYSSEINLVNNKIVNERFYLSNNIHGYYSVNSGLSRGYIFKRNNYGLNINGGRERIYYRNRLYKQIL